MVLPRQYGLGTVVTFRYTSPTATDRMPMVMVLTPQHRDGHMHGVNLRYMSPLEQRQIQFYFQNKQQREETGFNPFQQQQIQNYQKRLEYEKQKQYKIPTPQELEQKIQNQRRQQEKEGYIVKPDPANQTFGVSTFTRTTNAQVQAAGNAMGTLQRYTPFGGEEPPPPEPDEPSPFANVNKDTVPEINDPYAFYYRYVNPMMGNETSRVYRKYNHRYISSLRILKGIERQR